MFKFRKKKQDRIDTYKECLIEMDYILASIENGIAVGETISLDGIPEEYQNIIKMVNDLMAKAYAPKVESKCKGDCKCQEKKKATPKKTSKKVS